MIEIPLPPLEVQRELVAEIEGYQRVLDGARMRWLITGDRRIPQLNLEWPLVVAGR